MNRRSCLILAAFALIALCTSGAHAAGLQTKPAQVPKPAATLYLRNDIGGADINCNQKDYNGNIQSFCNVCGGLKALEAACRANPACKSFTFECSSGAYCGYLKSVGPDKAVYREDYCVGVPVK